MRYVYPYKKTNGPDTLGLSIKSVLQADPQAQIFIVGDPYPVGNHIALSSLPIRGCDVTNKMMHFAWHYDGDFMYMNDDFFITKEFNPYVTYTSGEMLINDKHSPTYQEAMQNTIDFLKSVDKPTMNYECHMPVVLNSDKLIGLFDRITWKHHNHFIKSMYLNYYQCEYKSGENVKVSNEIKKAQDFLSRYGCFSTSDTWFNQKAQREFITKHLIYSA